MAKMTIYIHDNLKRRMDAVEGVNWSPLACHAFEEKLAEIITLQGAKDMDEVIARLKASKSRTSDTLRLAGQECGKAWASETAEAIELERLENWTDSDLDRWTWQQWLETAPGHDEAFGPDHRLAESILGEDLDRSDGDRFWADAIGDDDENKRYEGPFLVGFVEGALAVWAIAKNKI